MPHLVVNPNTAQCPNYVLDIYQAVWIPFVTPDLGHNQAAVILTTVWEAQNTVEKQQWQEQLDQDAADADERRQEAEATDRMRS